VHRRHSLCPLPLRQNRSATARLNGLLTASPAEGHTSIVGNHALLKRMALATAVAGTDRRVSEHSWTNTIQDMTQDDGSPTSMRSWSMRGLCPLPIRSAASSSSNQPARSTSGNCLNRPERGGHSREKVLLLIVVGSQSASTAKAWTTFPPACFTGVRVAKFPATRSPVSSVNSRFAACSGSSPSSNSPFGMDHAPLSLPFH
jgi:hypothetical protein